MIHRKAPRLVTAAFVAIAAMLATFAGPMPAQARDSYVQDGAHLFKPATISSLNSSISDLQRQTGKEIVVVTVPSLDGKALNAAVEETFSQQQVNGVLFFFAKEEKKDYVVGDRVSTSIFPHGTFSDIASSMRGDLRSGDPDGAITTGVHLVIDDYRGHESALGHRTSYNQEPAGQPTHQGGFNIVGILILIAGCVIVFMIIRAVIRAVSGPRMMGGGPGYGGPGYGGPGYGGPGYGGGYGGGGGGFFSGLLGGLGGAFIGNELFGRRDDFGGGNNAGFGGGNDYNNGGNSGGDTSGFQSDPGQADMSGGGGGDWGGGGGGGDFGGGGGGDSGGGW